MSFRSDELRVIEVDEDHVMGTWAEFLIMVWRVKTLLPAVQRAKLVMRELAKAHPNGIASLAIVEQTALPPEQDVRRELSALLSGGAGHVKSSSVVHEGTGFKAATVRGVVTALSMFGKLPFPHVIHATVSESAEWHMKNLQKPTAGISARGLCQAVDDLRNALDRHAQSRKTS